MDLDTASGTANEPATATTAAERSIEEFVRANTAIMRTELVPEIELYLASDCTGIFQVAAAFERPGERYPPFWAFAWPGGQALARHLLDHPEIVAGKRVADIGAGSGITSIAAAMAGAKSVLAADVDPLSVASIRRNAAANAVVLAVTADDVLGGVPDADVIVIGDLVYEPELATRVAGFLDAAALRGALVLFGDRTTAKRPPQEFELVVESDAPVVPELPGSPFERARVWRLIGVKKKARKR